MVVEVFVARWSNEWCEWRWFGWKRNQSGEVLCTEEGSRNATRISKFRGRVPLNSRSVLRVCNKLAMLKRTAHNNGRRLYPGVPTCRESTSVRLRLRSSVTALEGARTVARAFPPPLRYVTCLYAAFVYLLATRLAWRESLARCWTYSLTRSKWNQTWFNYVTPRGLTSTPNRNWTMDLWNLPLTCLVKRASAWPIQDDRRCRHHLIVILKVQEDFNIWSLCNATTSKWNHLIEAITHKWNVLLTVINWHKYYVTLTKL